MSLQSRLATFITALGADIKQLQSVVGPSGPVKVRVKACATANVTLTAPGTTIDGVTMANGDRFFAPYQTTKSQTGVYIFNGSASTATRDTDFDTTAKASDAIVVVDQGTNNNGTLWLFPLKSTNTLGTTNVTPRRVMSIDTTVGVVDADLPGRLKGQPTAITDWSTVVNNGHYCSAGNATDVPKTISGEWIGIVLYSGNYQVQLLFGVNDDSLQPLVYIRGWYPTGGAWSSWFQFGPAALSMFGGAELVNNASGTSGTVTLDCSKGNIFTLSPSGNVTTLTISNPPSTNKSCVIRLIVTQGATPRTIATPTGGVFMGAATPTQVANKVCIFDYETVDGGTTWYCSGVVQV